jgi:hypothetical protein
MPDRYLFSTRSRSLDDWVQGGGGGRGGRVNRVADFADETGGGGGGEVVGMVLWRYKGFTMAQSEKMVRRGSKRWESARRDLSEAGGGVGGEMWRQILRYQEDRGGEEEKKMRRGEMR